MERKTNNAFLLQAKVGDKPLPYWLLFDKIGGSFWGLPTLEDLGESSITVKAFSKNGSCTKDFKLNVIDAPLVVPRPDKCLPNEEHTVLNLLIGKDIKSIKPKQRIVSLNNIAKFLGLPYVSTLFFLIEIMSFIL